MEVWTPARGYQGYSVSDEGRIRNDKTGRILKQFDNTHGYLHLTMQQNKRPRTVATHRLVADSFMGGDHVGLDVNHIDGNKHNNHISNLEYCTRKENIRHAFDTGLKEPSRRTRVRILETGRVYRSLIDCERNTGLDRVAISKCLQGKQHSHRGYHFEKL